MIFQVRSQWKNTWKSAFSYNLMWAKRTNDLGPDLKFLEKYQTITVCSWQMLFKKMLCIYSVPAKTLTFFLHRAEVSIGICFNGFWRNLVQYIFFGGVSVLSTLWFHWKKKSYVYQTFLFLGMFGFGLKIFPSLMIRTLVDLILTPKVFQLREKTR